MSGTISVTTTGVAGSATGTGTGTAYGVLAGIVVNYHASAPATTTVVVKETISGVDRTILSLGAGNTDGYYNPQSPTHAISGGAAVADVYAPFVLSGSQITVTVDDADALTGAVQVTLLTVN
jgi:hypothetical protein